jgi:MYXO-CTERM domain-containing protein
VARLTGLATAPFDVYTKAHSSCCEQPGDTCVFEGNGTCDCLRDDWDQDDCTGFLELIPAMEMLDDLAARHVAFTRLTTRVSPEEMTFDPFFVPDFVAGTGQDAVVGFHYTLDACEPAILGEDEDEYRAARARLDCAAVYCGHGTCATTDAGAACACDAGYVARAFTDLDGLPSVTCVPAVPLVDLEAGGIDLPDACATTSCGAGVCVDQNGVATCACDSGAAAVAGERPQCVPIVELTGSPGGEDFSEAFTEVRVCAPPPPSCGADGSLVFHEETPGGVSCGGEVPDPSLVGDPCDEGFFEGCGCRTTDGGGAGALLGVLVALLLRRRKETV